MRRLCFGLMPLVLAACGPASSSGGHVKTPEELVAEQEALAAEQEKESQKHAGAYDSGPDTETDLEKKKKFDAKQADLELKRASRSAATCANVVTEENPPTGKVMVTMTFSNEGHVKEATLGDSSFQETQTGKCVLNAMKAVIVPAYVGPEETVEFEVEVAEKEKKEEAAKKKK